MPIKCTRKTDKAKWTAEDIKKSQAAVAGGLSIRKAKDTFIIPFSTL
jgi:hypothetical protein